MVKEKSKTPLLKVKDHSVSGEMFQLIENTEYGFLETFPKPAAQDLPNYYESEDYISHTDAKRNLFEKVYHLVRKISLKKKLKLIESCHAESKTLLDVGCGTGDFIQVAKQNNWKVTGVEPNEQARSIANKKNKDSVFDVDQLVKLQPQSFDVVTLWHVLEHLPNLEEDMATFKKLLKPTGTLIIAVPNYKSYDAQYYKEFWAAYDVPRHLWHFNKASMSKLVNKVSLELVKIKPMYFDAFYVSLLSEKYKHGKMKFFNAIRVATLSNLFSVKTKQVSSLIYVIKATKN
ncbi:class I SAM-dependent methyltransferase [Mariniflexile aquimaris]|uniref:Class I SAM-dependent methyltransferase n=1 Tax=Mariniflexile aquimaris TaxID=881009 RepID=A0ABW3BNT4_9FLAO